MPAAGRDGEGREDNQADQENERQNAQGQDDAPDSVHQVVSGHLDQCAHALLLSSVADSEVSTTRSWSESGSTSRCNSMARRRSCSSSSPVMTTEARESID